MRLPLDPFDRTAQDDAINDALKNTASTAIYLDTSSLVWMYRLASGARTEFISWAKSGSRDGKVHIPAWSLHELHRHRRAPDTLFPARPKVRKIATELAFLRNAASLFIDDELAIANGFIGRDDYLAFLDVSMKNITRTLSPLKEGKVDYVESQLIPFFQEASLTLSPLPEFASLQGEFQARNEGRVPPGYHDASKKGDAGEVGGEGANRFGDFALWKEILNHSKADASISKVIIVTHDQKPDWVFVPGRFIGHDRKLVQNSSKAVTCPHPTLCHEAAAVAGVSELYIITIPQLIQLLSTHGVAKEVQLLAQAVQIEQSEEKRAAALENDIEAKKEVPDLPEEEIAEEVQAPEQVEVPQPVELAVDQSIAVILNSLQPEALIDADYQAIGGDGTPDPIIRALKTYDWYRQNPAIKWVSAAIQNEGSSYEQIFVLGRNVYQAACGNSRSAVQLVEGLENFLSNKPRINAKVFFSGILFEAYFDSQGQIRATPKGDYLLPLFIVAGSDQYVDVILWFRGKIGIYQRKFIRLPGDRNPADIFVIRENDGRIVDISLRGISLVREINFAREWSIFSEETLEKTLRQGIADYFATSEGFVQIHPRFADSKDCSQLAFIEWGTNTDVEFPPFQAL